MGFFGASDIDGMLSTFGVPIVCGAVSGVGILDMEDVPMLNADGATFSGHQIRLTVKTGDFPSFAHGTALTADGVAYSIITARQQDDGALTVAFLARA